jgi:hypothetical protein
MATTSENRLIQKGSPAQKPTAVEAGTDFAKSLGNVN